MNNFPTSQTINNFCGMVGIRTVICTGPELSDSTRLVSFTVNFIASFQRGSSSIFQIFFLT